jgi:hypothetical protein
MVGALPKVLYRIPGRHGRSAGNDRQRFKLGAVHRSFEVGRYQGDRNGMPFAKSAYEQAGLGFGSHTVAATLTGSDLDKFAAQKKLLARFPMWDCVGRRTGVLSAIGLPPIALQ